MGLAVALHVVAVEGVVAANGVVAVVKGAKGAMRR